MRKKRQKSRKITLNTEKRGPTWKYKEKIFSKNSEYSFSMQIYRVFVGKIVCEKAPNI